MEAHLNDTVYVAPPIFLVMAAVVVVYLVMVGYLMNYLKRVHPAKWEELGSPSILLNNSIRNGLSTSGFIFGGKYRQLNDPRLGLIIWAVRALLTLVFTLLVIGLVFSPIPPR
jgi:hypothetical protein